MCASEVMVGARFCPFDGTSLDGAGRAGRDPLLGAVIGGRYRIGSRLGSGGFAVVYLGHHLGLGIDVAVKVLQPMRSGEAVARFAREARAASRIAHENVVKVFDFGHADEGFHYLVMEHVAGAPLDAEIARCAPFEARRAAHILGQIASGVGRAHEMGIVHRDLKPENVILTQRGTDRDFVKVLDFGLAKLVQPDASTPAITRAGEVFGTPEYMAPEQWRGKPADWRTDIYAMGIVGYEMLTGKRPFDGDVAALMMKHLEEAPPLPRDVAPDADIPELLAQIVMVCLRKSPDERYSCTNALLHMLGRVWPSEPSRHGPTSYRGTLAAPSESAPDSIADPTGSGVREVDAVWDGPILCAVIRRLHALRRRRLADLTEAIWHGRLPRELGDIAKPVADLELEVESSGEEVVAVETRLRELVTSAADREAELRGEILDASVLLELMKEMPAAPREQYRPVYADDDTLPQGRPHRAAPADTQASSLGPDEPPTKVDIVPYRPGAMTENATTNNLDAAQQIRSAERQIASLQRATRLEEAALQTRLMAEIARLRGAESRLAPLYDSVRRLIERTVAANMELREQLLAFREVDGALATRQSLLALL